MIKTDTLEQAISEVFNLSDVPQFTDYKPFKQAREWLERKEIPFEFKKRQLGRGIVAFSRGAGQPQYAIVTDENVDQLKGAMVHGTLEPVADSLQPSDDEPTETEEKPTPKKRSTRRKK
jgi:hypothetical protein